MWQSSHLINWYLIKSWITASPSWHTKLTITVHLELYFCADLFFFLFHMHIQFFQLPLLMASPHLICQDTCVLCGPFPGSFAEPQPSHSTATMNQEKQILRFKCLLQTSEMGELTATRPAKILCLMALLYDSQVAVTKCFSYSLLGSREMRKLT